METFQQMIEDQLQHLPRIILEKHFSERLVAAGMIDPGHLPQEIATHLMKGTGEPFYSPNGPDLKLSISDEDLEAVESKLTKFMDLDLPRVLEEIVDSATTGLLKKLKKKWRDEKLAQQIEVAGFRDRLEQRWGKGLDLLRMLVTIAREWGQAVHQRQAAANDGETSELETLLLRQHVRACQVAEEVIVLLENGFADGAMARWRTLHEITIVTTLIEQHGADLAERYIAYQAVESKRALDMYIRCHRGLGYRSISKTTSAKINARFRSVKRRYGDSFVREYGWAAHCLKKPKLNFAMLEEAAGQSNFRSYYKMASYNVHASPRGAFFRLGVLKNSKKLLAGRSNAGLMEAGQNTAMSLTQISFARAQTLTFDDIVTGKVMVETRDLVSAAFLRATIKLAREEKHLRKLDRVRRTSTPS